MPHCSLMSMGTPLFYFKIEVIIWQIFSGQSLNKNLLQLSFQWNYLKRRHNSETAWFSDGACLLLWLVSATASLRTQTYFRLSLVSAENNFCEPEPGNDFCDVMTFVTLWPIRFHDRMKLECSSQRIPRAVVLGLLELNCDWLRIPTSQKSFPGSGSRTLFSAETSDSRK